MRPVAVSCISDDIMMKFLFIFQQIVMDHLEVIEANDDEVGIVVVALIHNDGQFWQSKQSINLIW